MKKLYVIIRSDMSYGQQAVQGGHAAIQFQHDHPQIATQWHEESKYLAYLSAHNESHLKELMFKADIKQIKYSVFTEPDIGDEITAIALEPSDAASKFCSSLPLAFKSFNQIGG